METSSKIQPREVTLYPAILKLFRKQPHAFIEVPYHGKRVDLVFSTSEMRYLYAVEVKIFDWRRAIKQAALNQLFAQLSYVAMPESIVSRFVDRHLELFRRHHLGLISVSDTEATIAVQAVRNGFLNLNQYRSVKMRLRAANASLVPKEIGVLTNAIADRSRSLDHLQAWTSERERALQA
jgi:tagatose-1,6-bisphosphate aldolase non-catalytic subunit AgaZ/GatZ